jgi:hypothetical protein
MLATTMEERALRLDAERRLAAEQEENQRQRAVEQETQRQIGDLQDRVRHLEVLVHRLLNEQQGDGR